MTSNTNLWPRSLAFDVAGGRAVSRNQQRAFTLVELLIVIGIIAVLISILLPALSKAQQQAKAVQCMSNLRQIGQVFNVYLDDNKGQGYIAQINGYPITPGATITNEYWYVQANDYATTPQLVADYSQGYLTQYMKDLRILNCPSAPSDVPDYENWVVSIPGHTGDFVTGGVDTNQAVRCDYAFNSSAATHAPKFSSFTKPSDTFALCDNLLLGTGTSTSPQECIGLGMSTEPVGTIATATTNEMACFHGRHSGGTGNVLWYDGHVTAETPYVCHLATSYSNATYAALIPEYIANNVGFLTPFTQASNPEASTFPPVKYPAGGSGTATGVAYNPVFYDYWVNKQLEQ